MKKVALFSLLVVFIVGSAFAQVSIKPKQPAAPADTWVRIEDDATGNHFAFHLLSGTYIFTRCSDGWQMKGQAAIQIKGCAIDLAYVSEEMRVLASVDMCQQSGKVAIEKFPMDGKGDDEVIKEYLSDTDMRDNRANCSLK